MSDKSLATSWHNNDDGDTYFKNDGRGNEYVSKSDSKNGRNFDHIHYYTDDETGNRSAKVSKPGHDADTGKTFKDKTSNDSYPADNLFEGVKNFLGF
jgi:hypothetical protein